MAAALDETLDGLPAGEVRAGLETVRASLDEPLRVAVAGRVSSGKSTLVNALLRQRAAPTGVGECTKIVCWYRHGVPERVEVRMRSGETRRLPLTPEGGLPESLGVDLAEVADVGVWLSNDTLRALTIIDTPGLSSVNEDVSQRTESLLALDGASRLAVAHADVLLFVLSHGAREDDASMLEGFRALFGGIRSSAMNAVAVLNKIDKLGADADPWPAARRVAARYAAALRRTVVDVHPVVGLLGETTDSGVMTEADVEALRRLAAMPPSRRALMLLSPDRFVAADAPVPTEARARLLTTLDLFGIGVALAEIDRGADSAVALVDRLRAASGVADLRRRVVEGFGANADALKAEAALAAVDRVSFAPDQPEQVGRALHRLREQVEEMRLDAGMHRLNEVRALHEVAAGQVPLPDELADDLTRLAVATTPEERVGLEPSTASGEVKAAALQAITRWKAFANDGRAGPRQRWVADVASRSLETIWAGADG